MKDSASCRPFGLSRRLFALFLFFFGKKDLSAYLVRDVPRTGVNDEYGIDSDGVNLNI